MNEGWWKLPGDVACHEVVVMRTMMAAEAMRGVLVMGGG